MKTVIYCFYMKKYERSRVLREDYMKIDRTVKKETLYIALVTLVLSVFMEGGFLVAGYYNYTVTLGNLLGATAAILNFFLLGISLQKALTKTDEKGRQSRASRLKALPQFYGTRLLRCRRARSLL